MPLTYRTSDHVFEERNDDIEFGQKLPIGAAVSKDVVGPALEEEREILPPSPEDQPARDPLYVVHYVPQGKDAGAEPPKPPKETGTDVLQKILSAGKGTAPQYPVFPAGCSQRNVSDWTPGVKASLCKASVGCLPGSPSCRRSRRVTKKQRSRCPPMTLCA
ncbi:uncharacterized protein TNCV_63911 [Trichonephila clavipes]|nr:uncharacterized protein TNCV_63911 [Trichonephila clavipes]